MYTKKLSESSAVMVAVRILWLAAITAIVAALFGGTAGLVVLGAGLLAGLVIELRPDRSASHPLATAAHEAPAHEGRHVLVIANTALEGEALARELAGPAAIDVLAPPLVSRTHLAVTDIDREMKEAHLRLNASLAWASDHGLSARGEVAETDAITGIADELRGFGADEVVVVSKAGEHSHVPERELERLRADLELPVRAIAI